MVDALAVVLGISLRGLLLTLAVLLLLFLLFKELPVGLAAFLFSIFHMLIFIHIAFTFIFLWILILFTWGVGLGLSIGLLLRGQE